MKKKFEKNNTKNLNKNINRKIGKGILEDKEMLFLKLRHLLKFKFKFIKFKK